MVFKIGDKVSLPIDRRDRPKLGARNLPAIIYGIDGPRYTLQCQCMFLNSYIFRFVDNIFRIWRWRDIHHFWRLPAEQVYGAPFFCRLARQQGLANRCVRIACNTFIGHVNWTCRRVPPHKRQVTGQGLLPVHQLVRHQALRMPLRWRPLRRWLPSNEEM